LKNIPVECASVLKPLFMKKGEVIFQISKTTTKIQKTKEEHKTLAEFHSWQDN